MARGQEHNGQERVQIFQVLHQFISQVPHEFVFQLLHQFVPCGHRVFGYRSTTSPHYKEQGWVMAMSCALLYLQGKSMMERAQEQNGQERARWSQDEDDKLSEFIERNGEPSSWKNVPRDAGLSRRSGKGCKLRWTTKLRKDINQNPLSEEEKIMIIRFQKNHGNKWEQIARLLQGRPATTIKNFWNSLQKKKLSVEDPQICPRNPVGIGFGPASITYASSIPAPVSASLEPSKADQVLEIVEVTPADQDSDWFLEELLRDQEPSDRFMENIFTSSPDADGSQNRIN